MKLTGFTDYSLRVLMYLAAQPTDRATIAQIATAFQVSEHHLVKVVHFLGKRGWLDNVRGKGGGLELGKPPEAIVIGSVVRETEGMSQMAECFGQSHADCCIASECHLRGVLGEAIQSFYQVLDRYTLADLVDNRRELARVLFVERDTVSATKPKRAARTT